MLITKECFSLRQLVMVAVVLFCTVANVIMDYMTTRFDGTVFLNPAYWINLIVQQSAVILIMLCIYSFMADKEEQTNQGIQELRRQITAAHCNLSRYGLTQSFDDYVYVKNYERKKRAYRIRMERKIFRCKKDERRKALQQELEQGLARIEYLNVRYESISIAEIFSHANLVQPSDESMSDRMGKTTAKMLRNKVIGIVTFGVLLSSVAFDPLGFGWGLLIKTFIKLFQAAYAIYVGGSEGIRFARGNLLSALENRAKFVQGFIEANKPSEQALDAMQAEAAKKEDEDAREILRRREDMTGNPVSEDEQETENGEDNPS